MVKHANADQVKNSFADHTVISKISTENNSPPSSPLTINHYDSVTSQQNQTVTEDEKSATSTESSNNTSVLNEAPVTVQTSTSKSTGAIPRHTSISVTMVTQSTVQNMARERRELLQSIAPSERRAIQARIRQKGFQQPSFRVLTESQEMDFIKSLDLEVEDISKENLELKRKVSLFQELFRDKDKLEKVLKRLEESN